MRMSRNVPFPSSFFLPFFLCHCFSLSNVSPHLDMNPKGQREKIYLKENLQSCFTYLSFKPLPSFVYAV